MLRYALRAFVVVAAGLPAWSAGAAPLHAADWPQFMRNAAHTGDADDESLRPPLGLAAQVRLDDAAMTSPAVVGGRAYIVDQMGTAYCIDPQAGAILWKTSPEEDRAMGSNTSSPCVAAGRVYYGTTAGNFHILNAGDGKLVRTIAVGSPIVSAPTFANGSIYFQALDAVLRCLDLDLDGDERWNWDHYARYSEPPDVTKAREPQRGHPGSYDRPHYGGGEVAVSGKKVVTSFGWDIVCLDDAGTEARLAWCNRAPNGRDGAAPMSSSISGDFIYNAGMGADGVQRLTRCSLASGEVDKDSRIEAYPWSTPAVRGATVTGRDSSDGRNGIVLFDCEARRRVASWRDEQEATPIAASHAFTAEHLVAATLRGEIVVIDLEPAPGVKPFRFRTPHGKGIGSSPAIADGRVHFGCDDGYFYVLASKEQLEPTRDEKRAIHEPRANLGSATGKRYAWPSTEGNPGNTAFADDPGLAPPLRVRWATRGFGHYKAPCIATETDVVSVTLGGGLIACQEQATGRTRWRVQMPGPEWGTSAGLLAEGGRLFVPRPTFHGTDGELHCLDLRDGRALWSADIGGRYIWESSSPVAAAGTVAFGSTSAGKPQGTVIQAWDAATGEPAWTVGLNVAGERAGAIAGCTDGKTMYFTAGAEAWQWKPEGDKQRGEVVAIDAASGKVQWRSHELFGTSYPVLTGDRLLLNEHGKGLRSVDPADGELHWLRSGGYSSRFSVAGDFIVMRGYGGHGAKVRLEDGKDYPGCRELGGDSHACSSVALTPKYAFGITVGGLNVRDVTNGELLWRSPGFAPRGCVNAALASGRVFWPSAASGMIFCWEPEQPAAER
ncbi:MAG: PQQ-binding-like beta-propeller repeat protein [Planctomycetales bacterium]